VTNVTSQRQAQIAALTSVLMIAQQVAGKAARDALFLTSFHTQSLPMAMAVGAVLSLAAVWLLSRLMARHAPASLAPVLFTLNAAGFGVESVLQHDWPRCVAGVLYLHAALIGPITISTFWSMVNERFDPHTAKKAVTRISGGGTLGGVLGGLASWRASTLLPPERILLGLAIVNALAALGARACTTKAERSHRPNATLDAEPAGGMFGSLRTLHAAAFLRNLALLVAIGSATSAVLDYLFSFQAVAHFGKGQALLSFFSLFWLAVGLLSFALQLALGRVALEKLSLALNIAVLPGIILMGGALGLAVPGLASSALLRGAEAVQRNTLFRSAYELLYTPVAVERKRTTKSLIDIGFDRLGTVVGSALVFTTLRAFGGHEATALLGSVVVLALGTFPVTRKLHLGYVEALQQSLKEAEQKLHPAPTSQRADLALSQVPPEREQLIEQLEHVQPGGLTALLDLNADKGVALESEQPEPTKALAQSLSLANQLLSRDPARIRHALDQLEPRDPGVSCALVLLADPDLHQSAASALNKIAPSITGQLIDALVDPSSPFEVRRRLPRVLQNSANQRAAEGLLLGLEDERFDVRYECGRALFKLTDAERLITISQDKTIAAIRKEVSMAERLVNDDSSESEEERARDPQTRLIEGLKRDRVNRSLEHVFNILCLHLDREPLRIAFRALHHEDAKFRGTALEYLATILPEEVREVVWPYLSAEKPLPVAREAKDLLDELSRTELSV
jgi:ATP:ADP antiporter, AAA family